MEITYANYLKIDELLSLQQPLSEPMEHDEMLFIIIHQTYELWFKQMLHEMGKLRSELGKGNTWTSVKTMRRMLTILKTMVSQIDILETMTPLEFKSFRDFLENASGFQSVQFREMELLCGHRSERMMEAHKNQPDVYKRLQKRMKEQTLWESFCAFLQQVGYDMPMPGRENKNGLLYNRSAKAQQILLRLMHDDPEVAVLAELFVDFDEGMQEWRYRHVKMVERTIGDKIGTGGSAGVNYLRKTLHQRIFPDLWEIRSEI